MQIPNCKMSTDPDSQNTFAVVSVYYGIHNDAFPTLDASKMSIVLYVTYDGKNVLCIIKPCNFKNFGCFGKMKTRFPIKKNLILNVLQKTMKTGSI